MRKVKKGMTIVWARPDEIIYARIYKIAKTIPNGATFKTMWIDDVEELSPKRKEWDMRILIPCFIFCLFLIGCDFNNDGVTTQDESMWTVAGAIIIRNMRNH